MASCSDSLQQAFGTPSVKQRVQPLHASWFMIHGIKLSDTLRDLIVWMVTGFGTKALSGSMPCLEGRTLNQ